MPRAAIQVAAVVAVTAAVVLAQGSLSPCEANGGAIVGSLWPLPRNCSSDSGLVVFPSSSSSIAVAITPSSGVVSDAVSRALTMIYSSPLALVASRAAYPTIGSIQVTIADVSDWPPTPGKTSEQYVLTVAADGSIAISADSPWGAVWAIQTLLQLTTRGSPTQVAGPAFIVGTPIRVDDGPRFGHRGVMLDTARHFLPLSTLQATVDAMAANKLNILHLHLVDAQSFPVVVPTLPNLSSDGAFSPTSVYAPSDLAALAAYALDRGVLVIPELDVPGHAYAWGLGYSNLTAKCPDYEANVNNIPLNPAVPFWLSALGQVLSTVGTSLPGTAIHVGGDEVVLGCWAEDPAVQQLMRQRGWSSTTQVLQYAITAIENVAGSLPTPSGGKRDVIHWQDVFDNGLMVSNGTIFQVWRSLQDVPTITQAGYRVIVSNEDSWYLNCGFNPICAYISWADVYLNEPATGLTPKQADLILGGEAIMFGEFADAFSLAPQLWPRASAVAERLWSLQSVTDTSRALPRLTAHRCRMVGRGVNAAPLGPGFCDPTPFV